MARKSRHIKEPEPKVDLTPMIDIIFNLIIFFMIVSDLSTLSIEDLQLAYADRAQKIKPTGGQKIEKILQINILEKDGLIKVNGREYTTNVGQIQKGVRPSLKDFLSIEALGYGHEDPPADNPGGVPPSKMRVNIRADKESAFQFVQEVFDACMKNGIYKTSLAATMDNPVGEGD